MGLTTDKHMSPADFSYLSTFFYVTFAVCQPIHGFLMQKFPTGKYLGINVILWGIMVSSKLLGRHISPSTSDDTK